ncbi:MAG: flagellar basal body-associated FliL family protein [Bdellovibrionales bacterium]|nr:flagellar basal body-associated FliL family protein [Bdellovibrionales bacterium]
MADEKAPAPGVPGAEAPSKLPTLIAIINTVVVVGAMGFVLYTRLLYKRPPITEERERERIATAKASPKAELQSGQIAFDQITVNIEPIPSGIKADPANPMKLQGKLHYATVAFSIEVRDMSQKTQIETVKPIFMDRLLSLMGKKTFMELTTVQGRYLLRTQLLDIANELIPQPEGSLPLVSDLHFTQFVVQ